MNTQVQRPRIAAGAWNEVNGLDPLLDAILMRTHNLSEIDRGNYHSLTNTEASHETTSIDGTEATTVSHEDSDTENPQETKLTRCPDAPDAITDKEGTVLPNNPDQQQLSASRCITYKRAPPTDPI